MVKNPPAIQETWIPSTCSQWNLCHFFSEITNSSVFTCLLLLLLSRFSRIRLCATPIDGSPPSGVGCHFLLQCMKVKSESEVAQSCSTLSDLMDCSLPGSSVHGIFQARVLEWGAIAFSTFVLGHSQLTGFPGGASGKEPTCQCRIRRRLGFDLWVGEIPWRRAWQPTPLFLPGESHRQRSLVGYCPRGHKEWDTTKATNHARMQHKLAEIADLIRIMTLKLV